MNSKLVFWRFATIILVIFVPAAVAALATAAANAAAVAALATATANAATDDDEVFQVSINFSGFQFLHIQSSAAVVYHVSEYFHK